MRTPTGIPGSNLEQKCKENKDLGGYRQALKIGAKAAHTLTLEQLVLLGSNDPKLKQFREDYNIARGGMEQTSQEYRELLMKMTEIEISAEMPEIEVEINNGFAQRPNSGVRWAINATRNLIAGLVHRT